MGNAGTSLLASDLRAADSHHDCSRRVEEHINENLLLGNLSGGNNNLSARYAAVGSTVTASGGGIRAVVDDDLLVLGSHRLAVLVCGNVLGEEITPVVVRVVVDIAVGVGDNAGRADGADIVGFSVVIPCDDLEGVSC